MDYGWMSHALVWVIGGITTLAVIGSIGALWSLGRTSTYDSK